jgi:hypothetical protein
MIFMEFGQNRKYFKPFGVCKKKLLLKMDQGLIF